MRKLGIFLVLFFAVPTAALAEKERLFWGVMLGSTDYEVQDQRIYVGTLSGRVGWDMFSWLAVEGRVLTSDSDSRAGFVDNFRIAYTGSVYAKLSLPPSRRSPAKFYALGGYSTGRFEFDLSGVENRFDDSGVSYGFGVELFANDKDGFNIEWLRVIDEEEDGIDYTVTQIGIGYIRRF